MERRFSGTVKLAKMKNGRIDLSMVKNRNGEEALRLGCAQRPEANSEVLLVDHLAAIFIALQDFLISGAQFCTFVVWRKQNAIGETPEEE